MLNLERGPLSWDEQGMLMERRCLIGEVEENAER